jgi:Inner membrane protein YgaP-like, transmembrane domain
MLERNVGSAERGIRVFVGIVALSLAFWGPKSIWGFLGIIPLATGVIGWCPGFKILGISSCKNKQAQKDSVTE